MKILFTAFILAVALTGVSLAQTSKPAELKMAVVEFSPGPNASGMTPDAKRQLQTALAAALARSARFDVADIRWTRNESQNDLAALNNTSSAAAAVKLGKKLGVKYVLTGTVEEYTLKGADGLGYVVIKSRIIEVATGRVKHTTEAAARSTGVVRTTGAVEMHSKTVKPAIDKLAAEILGSKL
jgi:TolB-like protein